MSAACTAPFVASLLCLSVVASIGTAAGATCNALISIDDHWYVSDEAGTLSAPFTAHVTGATGVSLSADGHHVAYLGEESSGRTEFVIAGTAGEPYRFVEDMDAGGRFPGVRWLGADILRTEVGYHVMAAFKFYRVHFDKGTTRLEPIAGTGSGASCVTNPQATQVACIDGYWVTVNDKTVYAKDVFAHAEIVDRFDMAFDEWHRIEDVAYPDEDQRNVHVTAVRAAHEHGQVYVAIRYGDPTVTGNESGGFMRPPAPIWMTSAEDLVGVSVSLIARGARLRVVVRRRDDDIEPLDNPLAWLPDGRGIAFLKYSGNQLIVMSQGDNKKWKKTGQLAFGRNDPIDTIRFVDAGTLFVEGQKGAALYSLPTGLKARRSGQGLHLLRTLPHQIEIRGKAGPVIAPVLSWVCR